MTATGPALGDVPTGWSTAKVNCSRSNHRLDARPLLLFGSLVQLGSSKVVLEAKPSLLFDGAVVNVDILRW